MEPIEIEIRTDETPKENFLGKFFSVIEEQLKGKKSPAWFRGQSAEYTQLTPSLFRYKAFTSNKHDEFASLLKHFMHEFKQASGKYLSTMPSSDLQWEYYMQHYGIKTRFLDWSRDPLAALYFAHQKAHDMAVWMIFPGQINAQILAEQTKPTYNGENEAFDLKTDIPEHEQNTIDNPLIQKNMAYLVAQILVKKMPYNTKKVVCKNVRAKNDKEIVDTLTKEFIQSVQCDLLDSYADFLERKLDYFDYISSIEAIENLFYSEVMPEINKCYANYQLRLRQEYNQETIYSFNYLENMDEKLKDKFPVCVQGPLLDERMVTQQSVLTYHNRYGEDYFAGQKVVKITIDKEYYNYIVRLLKQLGYVKARLFPTLDNVAKDISRRVSSSWKSGGVL